MLVKVAPVGEVVKEVNVAENTSVGECLAVAHITANGRSILLNGKVADESTVVKKDGSIIVLAQKQKGGI